MYRWSIVQNLNWQKRTSSDIIMSVMASKITSVLAVNSTVCSDADKRKYQSSASLAVVRGIHRWPVNSPHKGPVTRKMFPFDDAIMDITRFNIIWYYIHWTYRWSIAENLNWQIGTSSHVLKDEVCDVHPEHWEGWPQESNSDILVNIGLGNGLAPIWHQAITWTNADLLSCALLPSKFSDIWINIKMHLKMSSAKYRPCCSGLNILRVHCMHIDGAYMGDSLKSQRCVLHWIKYSWKRNVIYLGSKYIVEFIDKYEMNNE